MIKELALYLFSSLPELAAAFLGTLGFGIVFKIKGKYLVYVSASGLFCYAIYLSALFFNCTEFVAATVAAMVVAAIAEILARTLRAPTVIFTIPGIVTIVPGSGLYYSVRYLLLRDFEKEVDSLEIGKRVMEELRELDQVAFVRFASVYRQFQAASDFISEIKGLKK